MFFEGVEMIFDSLVVKMFFMLKIVLNIVELCYK